MRSDRSFWSTEKGDEWSKISSNGVEGYIKNEYLVFGEEAKAHIPAAEEEVIDGNNKEAVMPIKICCKIISVRLSGIPQRVYL